MKKLLFFITSLLFVPISPAFAHEEGGEFTNIAEADWISPLIAIVIIIGTVIFSRIIRAERRRKL